jgi:hypothetical protein
VTPGPDASAPAYRLRSVAASAVDAAGTWVAGDGANGHADRVLVHPGTGALATSTGGGTAQLLSAVGERFAVASKDDLGRLGYGSVTPTPVPAAVLDLFPEGPSLDANDARTPRTATVSAP